jgi:hypothetical protein
LNLGITRLLIAIKTQNVNPAHAGFKKTAATERLKELAVLGGGNSDTKPLQRS